MFNTLNAEASKIKSDEYVEFFTTVGHFDASRNGWVLPLHAWVYEPEDSYVRKEAIAKILKQSYGLGITPENSVYFDERINLLLADNEGGIKLVIRLLGKNFKLKKTLPNGHVQDEIFIPSEHIDTLPDHSYVDFSAILPHKDKRSFKGRIHLWEPTGLSIISDLDDTVKITEVTDKAKLFENTFYQKFTAVSAMASIYADLVESGAILHFVSSSPWHLYRPINNFLNEAGFPERSMSLKQVRLKDRSILNLFKSGIETKIAPIEQLMLNFPERHFILFGDNGEQDPEVYAAIYRKFPQQIKGIYIRNVTGAAPNDDRFQKTFAGVPTGLWHLFIDPGEIRDAVFDLNLN